MSLNIVAIMGRLTSDPGLKTTPNGVSVTSFTLAIDRSYAKAGTERQADFVPVVAWRGTAEFICKYFQKGRMMAVQGAIQTRTYTDKDGNKRKAFEVVASEVSFAGDKSAEKPGPAGSQEEFSEVETEDDLPF